MAQPVRTLLENRWAGDTTLKKGEALGFWGFFNTKVKEQLLQDAKELGLKLPRVRDAQGNMRDITVEDVKAEEIDQFVRKLAEENNFAPLSADRLSHLPSSLIPLQNKYEIHLKSHQALQGMIEDCKELGLRLPQVRDSKGRLREAIAKDFSSVDEFMKAVALGNDFAIIPKEQNPRLMGSRIAFREKYEAIASPLRQMMIQGLESQHIRVTEEAEYVNVRTGVARILKLRRTPLQ